ncbi:MAG: sigma-54-dependent Fis family transcriptional regulator [Archangiaceae bacterium]|nr:sigma-54-dependent Fis family transcriptional regulator [Archangiaceae bacterium]
MPRRARILVVDDQLEMARVLADDLTDAGYVVDVANSAAMALEQTRHHLFDLVISDLRMEQVDGFDLLKQLKSLDPDLPVVIMTAFGAIDSAVAAIKLGAYHYVTKPFRLDEVTAIVGRALEERQLRTENRSLKRLATERSSLGAIVGRSAPMQRLFELIERVSRSSASVLICGETGTGKELVAKAIHFSGTRREGPFVAINCTALPEALLESELFGHVKGAFTGATSARHGLFAEADRGTILLDEIGDMPLAVQARLLRVLEEGEVRAVGSDDVRRIDVRVLAATNRDLALAVREKTFRQDLFYRLNVVPITVPPLRDRVTDIPLLVEHFLDSARHRNPEGPVRELAPDLIAALAARAWPGNVRELENLVERLVVTGNAPRATKVDLDRTLAEGPLADASFDLRRETIVSLRQLEAEYIAWAISRCDGNKTRAAELLGIDVSTIHRRGKGQGEPT